MMACVFNVQFFCSKSSANASKDGCLSFAYEKYNFLFLFLVNKVVSGMQCILKAVDSHTQNVSLTHL